MNRAAECEHCIEDENIKTAKEFSSLTIQNNLFATSMQAH